MAAVAEGRNEARIYWIKDTSEDEQSVIPGPSKKMGLKSASINGHEGKVKGRADRKMKSGKEIKDLSVVKPLEKTVTPPQMGPISQAQELFHGRQAKSKASLKDLCPEDKRRIANLIEELARVSEEKEQSVQRLRDEQEVFEKKIQQLEEQNQVIIHERESLQHQYRECQELLGLYQQYLSQQQEKLNKSITQMNQSRSHCKMASSERTASQACGRRATHLDGSYLDHACRKRTVGTRAFIAGPHSMPSCCSHQASGSNEQGAAGASNCSQGGWSEPGPDTHSEMKAVVRSLGAAEPSRERKNDPECSAAHRETRAPGDRQDWEVKRQRLLLQKKQLEVERERLQVRLAQQEERLLKQNQELRESRLNYSKIHQAAMELEQTFNGLVPNTEARASASEETHSVPREGGLQALKGSVRQPVNDVQLEKRNGNVQPPEPTISREHSAATKKDMATSPVHSQNFQKSSPPQLAFSYPRTPKPPKLDASLIDLLDVLSPIDNTDRSRMISTAHGSLAGPCQALSGVRAPRLSPRGQTQVSQEELQESQILEDIFFIC